MIHTILLKKHFRIPGWWVGFTFKLAFKKREGHRVIGITNKIGSRYVLFLDYDIKELKFILEEVADLQDRHKLGNAYFFESGRGYHVIIPDLFTYREIVELLQETSIEAAYLAVPRRNAKVWVLRCTPKGDNRTTYLGLIRAPGRRLKSAPHLRHIRRRGVPKALIQSELLNSSYGGKRVSYATYEA